MQGAINKKQMYMYICKTHWIISEISYKNIFKKYIIFQVIHIPPFVLYVSYIFFLLPNFGAFWGWNIQRLQLPVGHRCQPWHRRRLGLNALSVVNHPGGGANGTTKTMKSSWLFNRDPYNGSYDILVVAWRDPYFMVYEIIPKLKKMGRISSPAKSPNNQPGTFFFIAQLCYFISSGGMWPKYHKLGTLPEVTRFWRTWMLESRDQVLSLFGFGTYWTYSSWGAVEIRYSNVFWDDSPYNLPQRYPLGQPMSGTRNTNQLFEGRV